MEQNDIQKWKRTGPLSKLDSTVSTSRRLVTLL